MLTLPVAVRKIAQSKIETGLKKFHPSDEERNPNMRFAENRVIAMLEENTDLLTFCEKRGLLWNDYQSLVKKFFSLCLLLNTLKSIWSLQKTHLRMI